MYYFCNFSISLKLLQLKGFIKYVIKDFTNSDFSVSNEFELARNGSNLLSNTPRACEKFLYWCPHGLYGWITSQTYLLCDPTGTSTFYKFEGACLGRKAEVSYLGLEKNTAHALYISELIKWKCQWGNPGQL